MDIIINRYSPRMIQVNDIPKEKLQNCIFLTPEHFKYKYELFETQYQIKINSVFLDDFVLPEFVNAIRKISQTEKIDKIITLCEEDVLFCGILNDYFINKSSCALSNIAFKDKYVMRSLLYGVIDQPYFRLISDKEDINKFFNISNSENAIIKPRDSAGSTGVRKISKSEIKSEFFFENEWIDRFMIEEFVKIENMLTCDGYSTGSNIERLFFHEYDKLVLSSIMEGKNLLLRTHKDYFTNNNILKKCKDYCEIILKNYGVENEVTPFHFEFFFDRVTSEIKFCEVGKRFGGGEIPTLILNSFGVNIVEEYWKRIFETIPPNFNRDFIKKPKLISAFYQAFRENGTVKNTPTINNIDWVKTFRSFVKEGEVTHSSHSIVESIFYAVFTSQNEKEYKFHTEYFTDLRNNIY